MGEIGLRPAEAKALSWPEVDAYLNGNQTRHQKQLYGPRLVALQVYNLLAEKPLHAHEYLPLPLIDRAPPMPTGIDAAFLARMEKRLGHPITLASVTD